MTEQKALTDEDLEGMMGDADEARQCTTDDLSQLADDISQLITELRRLRAENRRLLILLAWERGFLDDMSLQTTKRLRAID